MEVINSSSRKEGGLEELVSRLTKLGDKVLYLPREHADREKVTRQADGR